MERRTANKRTRVANPEAAAVELAEHYARILGQQADRQVSDVVRTCLRRLPSRLAIQGEDLLAVEELIERVLRLGEVGARDPIGSPRQIDDYIARRLGEPASGPRRVYRALRAMVGHTVLVERRSRQIWMLCLSGITDSSSILHRTLLRETPAPYSLPVSDTDSAAGSPTNDPITPPKPSEPVADPSHQLRAQLARLHEELAAERMARVEVDKHREAADTALDEEKRARGEADRQAQVAAAQLAALERELSTMRRALAEERRARDEAGLRGRDAAAQHTALERELGALRRAVDQERRAREEADLRGQAGAAQRTALTQELGLLRRALDEERRAHGEADKRGQVAETELAAMRDAQAADAATMRRLLECDQTLGAAAFLMARMHGRSVDEAIESVRQIMPAAAAVLLEADTSPQMEREHGPHTDAPALSAPLPSSVSPASASVDGSAAIQTPTPHAAASRRPTQRPHMTRTPVLLVPETELDQSHVKPTKVGRNDPCPCGSSTKYKRCCGRAAP